MEADFPAPSPSVLRFALPERRSKANSQQIYVWLTVTAPLDLQVNLMIRTWLNGGNEPPMSREAATRPGVFTTEEGQEIIENRISRDVLTTQSAAAGRSRNLPNGTPLPRPRG